MLHRTKTLTMPTALLNALILFCLYRLVLPKSLFHPPLLVHCPAFILESILCDYLVNATAREEEGGAAREARSLPLYLACRPMGAMAGALVGFRLMRKVSKRFPLLVCSGARHSILERLRGSHLRLRFAHKCGKCAACCLCSFALLDSPTAKLRRSLPAFTPRSSSEMAYLLITDMCTSLMALAVHRFFVQKLRPEACSAVPLPQ